MEVIIKYTCFLYDKTRVLESLIGVMCLTLQDRWSNDHLSLSVCWCCPRSHGAMHELNVHWPSLLSVNSDTNVKVMLKNCSCCYCMISLLQNVRLDVGIAVLKILASLAKLGSIGIVKQKSVSVSTWNMTTLFSIYVFKDTRYTWC